jgi:hypothetical protein
LTRPYHLLESVQKRQMPSMKSKLRSLLILSMVVTPLCGAFSGCSQGDNPTPVKAPPPPPPSADELKVPKDATGKKAYGSGSAYQKAMDKLNKP